VIGLFFEQVIECASSVGWLRYRRRSAITAGISSFSLDGSPSHKKFALIPQILLGNPFRYRLCAFEARRRIKMTAILTSVEVGLAFWTLAIGLDIDWRRNYGPAQGTAQDFLKSGHF
jgi:hypothetical protein